MTKILVTNNGPHSPETWAMATAEVIFDINPSMTGLRLIQAQKLRLSIAEALMPHHSAVCSLEKANLSSDDQHILTAHWALDNVNQALTDIVNAAKGTPWQEHFEQEVVQDAVKEMLHNHFRTAQHIERLWYADNNPDNKAAQEYKVYYNPEQQG